MTARGRKPFPPIDDAELDEVNGGWLPLIYAAGAAILPAAGNPSSAVGSFVTAGEYASRAWDAVHDYLNPSPGHGAPGDTYVPASMNQDGSITPGHFDAPPPDPNVPHVPMSVEATPVEPTNQFAQDTQHATSDESTNLADAGFAPGGDASSDIA